MDTQTKSFAESVRNTKQPCSQTPAKKVHKCGISGGGKDLFQIYDELEGVLGRDPHISTTNRRLLIEAILRYRAYNGGTFQQARAAVVLEVAKEVRPRTYAQVTKSTRAPVASANAPDLSSKVQQVTPGTRGVTREKISAPTKIARSEDRRLKKKNNRYGTESDLNIDSIDSIWNVPKDFCRTGRRAGGTSPPSPATRQQSPPSQPPPRAPVPEESDSGDIDTDLGSALSADHGKDGDDDDDDDDDGDDDNDDDED
ncbi:hypothetical protein ElyMa_001412100 [Elysia marginata]|uniref:Uncharacterized protein n=1 Tax=Elysia marginata TaxID=1093978 RepID=A0AAV4IV48_9GAST|nr:hypothetical protein ElyMa_001412100 [Elysia marginata]